MPRKAIETYADKLSVQERQEMEKKIERALKQHERFQRRYYSPSRDERERKAFEEANEFIVCFRYDHKEYTYTCRLPYSQNDEMYSFNMYIYKGRFREDKKRVTVRTFKRILRELQEADRKQANSNREQ